jgi:hypothetical protein
VLIAAGLLAVIFLTYLTGLGRQVEAQRDQTGAQLFQVTQATVAACRDGVVVPAPSGITACAEAIKATPGPIDPASVAALVRSIIGVTDPTARFDPGVIAAQLAALLPGLPGQVVATVVDAQVAAAQGAAREPDAASVTEGAVSPLPGTGAAAPVPAQSSATDAPDEGDRPGDAPPVDPRDDDTAAPVEPSGEAPRPEPSAEPQPGAGQPEPQEPTATSIEFARDADGRCQAVTTYDDGSRASAPADEQSCGTTPSSTPSSGGSTPTNQGSTPSSEPDAPATSDSGGPLIRVN